MTTSSGDWEAALSALCDLIDTARNQRDLAAMVHRHATASRLDGVAQHLDAVRTRMIEEPDFDLLIAWAFVDAGRLAIAVLMRRLGTALAPIPHARPVQR